MEKLHYYHKYLNNEMTDLESDEFTRAIVKSYFEEETLKAKWKGLLKNEYDFYVDENSDAASNLPQPKNISLKVISAIAAIAACLLLMWTVGIPTQSSVNDPVQQLLSEHYAKPFTRDVLKGISSSEDSRMSAYDYYQNKNYQAAIPFFEELIQGDQVEESDAFFLGLSYLYTAAPEKAIPQFKSILERAQSNYKDAATWYLGLALADAEKFQEAKIYLNEVAAWKGNQGKMKLASDARELLKIIMGQ